MADDSIQDWSLQAIVRGSSGDYTKIVDHTMDIDESFFDVFGSHHQQLDGEFLESLSNGYIDELQEFYKPFYRVDPPNSIPSKTSVELHDGVKNSVEAEKDHQTDLSSGTICVAKDKPAAYTPKYKRRKNQQKRVVTQVSAEGLASDLWAWRKYGQKPIKGSPYPRSYYRCSSSKGCLARKQVEQSCIDPGKFIITYSAEHNHSQPTRRNSLAGTVRQKFPSPKSLNKTHVKQENWEDDSSIITSAGPHEKPEQVKKEEQRKMHDEINEFLMSDFVFEGDLFSGLEGFDEFESELPTNYSSSSQQFPVRSCS